MIEERDVVIVGSGPAGCATAIALHRRDPALARRALVIEAFEHPREKVCAGGINGRVWNLLERLDMPIKLPSVEINRIVVKTVFGEKRHEAPAVTRVALREDFDTAIAAHLKNSGIELREGTRVTGVNREGNNIVVETADGAIRARAVVGADGVGSVVRRDLFGIDNGVFLTAMASCPAKGHFTHEQNSIYLDFSRAARGAAGYRWIFPFIRDSEQWINTGICEWTSRSAEELKEDLGDFMKSHGFDPAAAIFRSFPQRPFHPRNHFCAPGALLVGEAAGIDPFFGEGISYSIEYGMLAADSLAEAMYAGDFSFEGHMKKLKWSRVGKELMMAWMASKLFYGKFHRIPAKALMSDDNFLYLLTEVLSGRREPSTFLAARMVFNIARALVK